MQEYIIYTDGACSPNPGKGGYGFIILLKNKVIYKGYGFLDNSTNNQMELLAPLAALRLLYKKDKKLTKNKIKIITDSKLLQNTVTSWMYIWQKNDWKKADGKEIKNKELVMELFEWAEKLDLQVSWVKAHNGDKYNEMVDEMAVKARVESLNKILKNNLFNFL